MPNKKQRLKNRKTAQNLSMKLSPKIVCPECGLKTRTGHFVHSTTSFSDTGFWICSKFYDPEGYRITE